jgi:hypothetical protein
MQKAEGRIKNATDSTDSKSLKSVESVKSVAFSFEFWILRRESDTLGPRFIEPCPRPRRGAGVVEQGCLLSSYTGKTGIGGSNPPLSATLNGVP